MPEPRAEPLRAKITVLGVHVVTSADPVWGEGKAWQSGGAMLGTAMIKQLIRRGAAATHASLGELCPSPKPPAALLGMEGSQQG